MIGWLQELLNLVLKEGRIPKDWSKSWMVSVYKGKGDALECGSYIEIQLLEHVMKIFERIIEECLREIVCVDSMQFGFMKGKEQLMRYSSSDSYKKSIWRKKRIYE